MVTIADFEKMPGHRDSAQLRLDLIAAPETQRLPPARRLSLS